MKSRKPAAACAAAWPRSTDSGFRIQDSGFRIQDSGFRIQDSGFRMDKAKSVLPDDHWPSRGTQVAG
jgi:hypothetical protein